MHCGKPPKNAAPGRSKISSASSGSRRSARAAHRDPPSPGILPPSPFGRIFLGAIVLIVVAFFAGYIPLQKRKRRDRQRRRRSRNRRLPRVRSDRSGAVPRGKSELELPGNIEAVTEAPILARADGYIKRRLVDIGDRVQAGQPRGRDRSPGAGPAGDARPKPICSRRKRRSIRRSPTNSRARPIWSWPASPPSAGPAWSPQGVVSQAG